MEQHRWKFVSYIPMNDGTEYAYKEPVVMKDEADAEVARLGGINTKMKEMLIEERANALWNKPDAHIVYFIYDNAQRVAREQIERELEERGA